MALNGVTKHPNLWFDDGNVVLIAESTGFCVYRGVLARQSEVFQDTFQMPLPTAFGDVEMNIPIVYLHDDSAEEIAIMLRVLFTSGHR